MVTANHRGRVSSQACTCPRKLTITNIMLVHRGQHDERHGEIIISYEQGKDFGGVCHVAFPWTYPA
jgi:hypothetical protein